MKKAEAEQVTKESLEGGNPILRKKNNKPVIIGVIFFLGITLISLIALWLSPYNTQLGDSIANNIAANIGDENKNNSSTTSNIDGGKGNYSASTNGNNGSAMSNFSSDPYAKPYTYVSLNKKTSNGTENIFKIAHYGSEIAGKVARWGNTIFYIDNESNGNKILSYDLNTGKKTVVVDKALDPDFVKIEKGQRGDSPFCQLMTIDSSLYASTCGYLQNGFLSYVDLPVGGDMKIIASSKGLSARLEKNGNAYFLTMSFGDGPGYMSELSLLDTKNKTVRLIKKVKGNFYDGGEAIIKNDGENIFVEVYDASLLGDAMPLQSIYSLRANNPSDKKVLISKDQLPSVLYGEDSNTVPENIILKGGSDYRIISLKDFSISKMIDVPKRLQNLMGTIDGKGLRYDYSILYFLSKDEQNIILNDGEAVYIYNIASKKAEKLFNLPDEFKLMAERNKLARVRYFKGEEKIIALGNHMYIYDAKSGKQLSELDLPLSMGQTMQSGELRISDPSDELFCIDYNFPHDPSGYRVVFNASDFSFEYIDQDDCSGYYGQGSGNHNREYFEAMQNFRKSLENNPLPENYKWNFE